MSELPAPDDPDPDLQAALNGDAQALGRLIAAHDAYLRTVAARVLGCSPGEEECSSVLQTTALKVVEHLGELRGKSRGEFLAWCARITHNAAVTRLRSRKPAEPLKEGSDGQPVVPDEQSSPSESVARREEAARTLQAVASLTPEQQEIIRLRNDLQMPWKEIADLLGISAESARQRWSRAIRLLRERLKDET